MAFDFPANPSQGQLFTPPNGPTYVFDTPVWKVQSSGGVPSGAVAHFAMQTAPSGWLKANGALISRTTYPALFLAIGTFYGAGDGSTTFQLPDLRGEFLRAWDDARGIDLARGFGSAQGDGIKTHDHTFSATSGGASADHTHDVGTLVNGTESADHTHTVAVSGTTSGVSANHTHTFSDSSSVSGTGSANHAHEPETTTYNFITALIGGGSSMWSAGAGSALLSSGMDTTNSTGAAHTHTVAVSGTTGANSVTHTHTFSDAASSTGGRSASHTHAITGSTATRSADHTHAISGTVAAHPGATVETRPRNIALLACIKY